MALVVADLQGRFFCLGFFRRGPLHAPNFRVGFYSLCFRRSLRPLAFPNGDSAMWDGLGSAHDKNLGRETHPTICDVFTKRFERVTFHFSHLIV
jgi:hypothetical protein